MADTLLTEREAMTVRRNFPRFTADQRAVATTKLESYRQAQEAAGLPLFPSRMQAAVDQRNRIQAIWLDGEEGWKQHSDGKEAPWRDAEGFREFQRSAVLSSMFENADPIDIASNPKAYRTKLAQRYSKPDLGTDDAAFDSFVTKTFQQDRKHQAIKYTDENSLFQQITAAAHDTKSQGQSGGVEAFLNWANANQGNVPPDKLAQWKLEARDQFKLERKRRDLAIERANKIIESVEGGEPIQSAVDHMTGLHPSDTALTYQVLRSIAGERGKDKGTSEKLFDSIDRQLARLASGVTGSIQKQAQLPFKEGQEVFEDLLGNPSEMALQRQVELSRPPSASLIGDAVQFAKGRRRVKLTAQQAQEANDAQNRLREGQLVLQQIRDADKGILDPVRKDWWGAKILYGGAETVTSMASYMVPYVGIGANALAFQSEAEDKLVAAGASREDARKASFVTAGAQAGMDRLQLGLLKKVPGIGPALRKIAQRKNPFSNRTLKALAKGAAIVVAETGIEVAQDPFAPALVQEIFAGLEADMPEVDWKTIRKEAGEQLDDVALSMIIPAALGAGFFGGPRSSSIPEDTTDRTLTAQASKYGYQSDPTGDTNSLNGIGHANNQLQDGLSVALSRETARKLGIRPKQTTDLLVTLPDGTQIPARYDDTIPSGYSEDRIDFYTPSGELAFDGQQVQVSVVGEGAKSIEDIRGGLADSARIDSAINSVARVRQVRRDADGWSIDLESGESLSVDSHEAALALREDLRQAATEREAQAMVELQDYFQSTGAETESLAFTGELATTDDTGAVTFSRDGEVTRILNDPRSMETMRAELDALATGDAGAVGREIVAAVNGMNVVETREGVSTLASQVFQGGGIKAQIHETVEARFRSLLSRGVITEEESLLFVKGVEKATGQKFIHKEATPDAIREAVSEIAVADFVSRRKSDKRLPGNAITAGLEEMIRGAQSPQEAKTLGKFRAFLRAARAFFREVFRAAAALRRARAEGKLEDVQEFLDQLLGLEPQRQHNEAVIREADPEYIPPTEMEEEEFGIAFSVGEYRIQHQPSPDDAPLPELSEMFGDDIYGPNAIRYFGAGQKGESEAVEIFRRVNGKPSEPVVIYRVVPDFVKAINPGDWVTISKAAANEMNNPEFLGAGLGGAEQKSKILKKEVKAGEVRWPGDSLLEQGYFPEGDATFSISAARIDKPGIPPTAEQYIPPTAEEEADGIAFSVEIKNVTKEDPSAFRYWWEGEQKDDYLYHTTYTDSAEKILKERVLRGSMPPNFDDAKLIEHSKEAVFFSERTNVKGWVSELESIAFLQGGRPITVLKFPKKDIEGLEDDVQTSGGDFRVAGDVAFSVSKMAAKRRGDSATIKGVSKVSSSFDHLRVGTSRLGTNAVPMATPQSSNVSGENVPQSILDAQLEKVANYPHLSEEVTAKGRESFIDWLSSNLLALHDAFPADLRDRATHWYDGAHDIATKFSESFGYKLEQAAGVLAVLSPQKDWFMNVAQGEQVMDIWSNHQDTVLSEDLIGKQLEEISLAAAARPGDKRKASKDESKLAKKRRQAHNKRLDSAAQDARRELLSSIYGKSVRELDSDPYMQGWAIRILAQSIHGRNYRVVSPEGSPMQIATSKNGSPQKNGWGSIAEIKKAVKILKNGSLDNISENLGNEHKVRNFYNNIVAPNNPYGDATIDTHAVAAGHLMPYGASAPPVSHNFGAGVPGSGKDGISGTYHFYLDAYKQAAKARGLQPRQMQSIVWEAVRLLYSAADRRNKSVIEKSVAVWQDNTDEGARKAIVRGKLPAPAWGRANDDSQSKGISTRPSQEGGENVPEGGLRFGGGDSAGSAFSISSEEYLERVAQRVAGITRAPKERLEAFERSRARLSDLASSLRSEDNVSKALSKNAIRKEKQIRKAADIEERVERIHEANPILEQEDLASLRSNPLIESLALKSKGPVRLNILSRSRAARRPGFGGMHGDYDGSHAIPGHLFGGTDASSAPDIVAQSAFESGLIASPTPDALWQEIERAMREAATHKEALSVARQEIASAKRIAQKEADAWEAEQLLTLSRRQKNTATKDLETGIRSLDALLLGLPAEIRAKVGGFSKMAKLRTNEAREAHLREKVERADRELERYLVEQYREDLTTILDKATPKMKGGERPSGNLGEAGHRFFDQVREVVGLTEIDKDAERAKIATLQQEEENIESAERMADLFEREQILDAFGGALTHMDAAGLSQALLQAQSVFTENRNKWRMVEEQRLKEVADLRSEIIGKLGQPTVRKKLAEIRKRDSKLKRLDDTAMGFISWVQTLEAVLGVNHPLVKRWNEAVGDAQAQKTDAMIVMNKRLERAVRVAIGGNASQLDAMQWMWDLNHKPAVTVSIKRGSNEDGSRAQTGRRVPVDVALRVIEDSQQATTLGFTPADVGALKQLFETNKNEREFFTLPGDYEQGTPELVELTEAEALTVSMLSLQEQYEENLEKWGYDEEVLTAIESSLGKEAKQLRQWMLKEYAEGWEPMNRVFSRMYGVALPQIGNYSPGNFEHMGADREMDAFGEGLMPTGGMRNGSLKTRKTHRAEPRIVSALGVYTSHVAQSEHFKAFAELTRELRGVFAHPAVKGAIKSSTGEEASGKVLKWIEVMENNGLQNPAGKDEAADKAKRLQGRLARIALAGKIGTLMVQSTAAMASSARIGQQAYWAGLARMMAGQGHYREFFNSPMIQRRIEAGASPAQRAAASRVMDRRPTRSGQGALWLMDLIGRVDGGFTAVSGAIAYDHHLRQLTATGMPETAAKTQAMREAEDVVRRTAQPVESTDKSLRELQPDAFARYFLLFASDARKNAAMVLEPMRRAMAPRQSKKRDRARQLLKDKDFWRAAMFTNVLAGGMAYLIRSAWWDMRDDDDHELFDDKHWNAWAMLRAMSFAPLEGLPLVRDVISTFKGGPLDGLDRSAGQIKSLVKDAVTGDLGSTPIERIERTVVATANASALLSERAVPVAVAANVFDQFFDVLDNTFDDSEEAKKKERARQRAE